MQTPVEFGHKVFLAENAQAYHTVQSARGESLRRRTSGTFAETSQRTLRPPPRTVWFGSGFFQRDQCEIVQAKRCQGGEHSTAWGKKTSKRETFEKSPDFKEGQRFRAGIEGRISVLFRGRGMKRCLAEGRERFELLVGAAVLTNNLMRIAALLDETIASQTKGSVTLSFCFLLISSW